MMSNGWKRPETTPYPRVYSRFKGKKPMPDGRVPDFWVQDATEDMSDAIVEHMSAHFMRDEPMGRSLSFYEDHESDEMMKTMSKGFMSNIVKQRLSVVAFTDWPDGEPHLAGANVLYHFRRGDEKNLPEIPNEKVKKFQGVMFLTLDKVDVYEKYGVDEFTTAVGLSVKPEFRGQNLGTELLKARVQMTKAVGLRLTLNNFTGAASQTQAARAGFELLTEIPYSEIKDENGDEWFPGITEKTLQFRAKYIGDSDDEEDAKQ